MGKYRYHCILCFKTFDDKQDFLVHKNDCSQKHGRTATYRILPNEYHYGEGALSNRFQSNVYEWVYRYLALRDGERCFICKYVPKPGEKLQIDHADNDITNNLASNLHLLCQHCNEDLRLVTPSKHVRIISLHSAKNESERESVLKNMQGIALKDAIGYENGSPEMKANRIYQAGFTRWLFQQLEVYPEFPKKEVINSGAYIHHCSTQTIERYLAPLVSWSGPLECVRGIDNQQVIRKKREGKNNGRSPVQTRHS